MRFEIKTGTSRNRAENFTQDAPAFALDSVAFAYDPAHPVLRGVSLSVRRGEKVVLLGANGCGKSTLLKILNGLQFATGGAVHAYGSLISEETLRESDFAANFRRRVGFVFQNSDAQLFSPTVREELAFGPNQLDLSEAETNQRIADVAAMFGIGGLLDRSPFRLSGGEKKRVALASVLAVNPDALLLDEPTGGLDPRSRMALVEMLMTLHRAGKTLVTATHDLDIVPAIADRVFVLDESGSLAAAGTPKEILADHELLNAVNLVHTHGHWHGELFHAHPHHHGGPHEHSHEAETQN